MSALMSLFNKGKGTCLSDWAILLVVSGFTFFQQLGRLPLLGTDEARYMEIPREMIERHDFITPTLNYVPYFEKPPLHYWLNAASTVIFGESAFAARFFGAVWGVLGILLVYHLGRKLYGRQEGLLSAFILGTSLGFVIEGRINITDTTLSFFLCISLGSFLLGSREGEKRKGLYYHTFFVAAALAVLAKGLIGVVLPALIIVSYLITTRRWTIMTEIPVKTGLVLFVLITAPWFIAVSLRNPGFFDFFFIHEHLERYLTKSHGRYQPPWFYFAVLFGCMLPWSFFIPTGCAKAYRAWVSTREDSKIYLLLWAGVILTFFSLSNSKLIPYILPAYPALALMLGPLFKDIVSCNCEFRKEGLGISLFHLVAGIGVIAYAEMANEPRITGSGAVVLGGAFLLQGITAAINATARQGANLFFSLAFCSLLLGILGPPVIYQGIANRKQVKDLALLIKTKAGQDAIVATFGYQQELPLYTKRRVVVVGAKGELEFGSRQGDNDKWFIEHAKFQDFWREKPVFALVPDEAIGSLSKTLEPAPVILGRQGRQTLITNRPKSVGKGVVIAREAGFRR